MRNLLCLLFILFTGSSAEAQWNYPSTKMEDSIILFLNSLRGLLVLP
jgi:hypothetical protein